MKDEDKSIYILKTVTGFRCNNPECYHHMSIKELKSKYVADNAVTFSCPKCNTTMFVGLI